MAVLDIQDAISLLDQSEPRQAARLLERLLDELPAYAAAHVLLARAYEELEEWDRALAAWRRAHHIIPNSPVIQNGLERCTERLMARRRDAPADPEPGYGDESAPGFASSSLTLRGGVEEYRDDVGEGVRAEWDERVQEIPQEGQGAESAPADWGSEEADAREDWRGEGAKVREDWRSEEADVYADWEREEGDVREDSRGEEADARADWGSEDAVVREDWQGLKADVQEDWPGREADAQEDSLGPATAAQEDRPSLEEDVRADTSGAQEDAREDWRIPEEDVRGDWRTPQEDVRGDWQGTEEDAAPLLEVDSPETAPQGGYESGEGIAEAEPEWDTPGPEAEATSNEPAAPAAPERRKIIWPAPTPPPEPPAPARAQDVPPPMHIPPDPEDVPLRVDTGEPEQPDAPDVLQELHGAPDTETPRYEDLDRLINELESARIVPRPDFESLPTPDLDDDIEDVVSETLARIYASQGQYDEAARVYELLAGQHPEDAKDYLQKATEMRSRASDGF